MTFSIELSNESIIEADTGYRALYGRITLNEFQERFEAQTTFWARTDYERHWRNAIERTVGGAERSALITSLHDPSESDSLVWWPLYRVHDQVFVHNNILFLDQIPTPFDLADPFVHLPKRRTVTEDGMKISEWQVSVDDLRRFLTRFDPGQS